jgi:hypothetical protein
MKRRLRLDRTLGPLVVAWIEQNLCHGPGDVQGQPVELDDERVKFLLRAYEIDDHGRRVVRRAVFSRSKGWGKSEFAGMIVCAEALGPVRFAGWDHDGKPLGRPVQAPYIPVAATEKQQAGNIYQAVEFMLQQGAVSATPGLDVGMTRTFLPDGGKIQPITAKAVSKEGGRESFAAFDEPHLYILPELHRLHETIRRNLAKRKAAEPWSLETSTMYAPGEDSVAEHSHSYAKAVAAGKIGDRSFLFDHRQGSDDFDFDDDAQLRAALTEAYGDAAEWIDLDRLIAEARDPQTDESDFKRYFINVPTRREARLFVSGPPGMRSPTMSSRSPRAAGCAWGWTVLARSIRPSVHGRSRARTARSPSTPASSQCGPRSPTMFSTRAAGSTSRTSRSSRSIASICSTLPRLPTTPGISSGPPSSWNHGWQVD